MHAPARPLRFRIADLQPQIVERQSRASLGEFDLFNAENVGSQFSLGGDAPQKFACPALRVVSSQQGRQQPLEPVRPCPGAKPAIQFRRFQMIRVKLEAPARWLAGSSLCRFEHRAGPACPERIHFADRGTALAFFPFEAHRINLQWLIQAGDFQLRLRQFN